MIGLLRVVAHGVCPGEAGQEYRSLDVLREMGVLIGSYEPHRPKAGGGADRYRWEEVLELLGPRLSGRS